MTNTEWKRVFEEFREGWLTLPVPPRTDFEAGQQSAAISSADYFLHVLKEGIAFHETSTAYMRKQRGEG